MIAFEIFNPTLVSRGSSSSVALKISRDLVFREQMEDLFSNTPSGYAVFYDLSWAVTKIRELEREILELKERLS